MTDTPRTDDTDPNPKIDPEADLQEAIKQRDEAQMEYADCWHEGDRLRADLQKAMGLLARIAEVKGPRLSNKQAQTLGEIDAFIARHHKEQPE